MKTKRFVSTLLALLLVCSLPVSAFAVEIDDCQKGEDKNIGPEDTMTNNNGTVTENYGILTNNYGKVETNEGTVTNNGTENGTENVNAYVSANNGTVTNNYGNVNINYKTVETNNGDVQHAWTYSKINTNNGTVWGTMTESEIITNNGTVRENAGTVVTNNTTGTVKNLDEGIVTTNYGTVKKADGTTWYGVQVDNDGEKTLEEYCEPNKVLDLTQFTKEGYELTGYTRYYQMGENGVEELSSPITESGTSYTVTCPNVLTLIWQAIINPGSGSGSGSGENASAAGETTADDGAGYFGPGSHIAINGHQYLLVAVVEDVYCLASIDSFEEEQLSDLPALLATLLTEEQLNHVTGEPELLDEELTAHFFGGQGSHIVFPCDKGLIFH